ncbi:MAG: hypothetical protein GX557_06810 [Chloroflexi bacterium]|nr:hypothetical protein [Chloroflexota bacterium]
MLYTFCKLSAEQLAKLQAFEQRTGKQVLAVKEVGLWPDRLKPEELAELQALEQELGCLLVAVLA